MELTKIISFLDETLNVKDVEDHYTKNGLQVEGKSEVNKVGFAVDACLEAFYELESCDLIIVHHGLFWPSTSKVSGNLKNRLKFLLEKNISLYSVHIPLDIHPIYGNNAKILNIFGIQEKTLSGFAYTGNLSTSASITEIKVKIEKELKSDVKLLAFGPSEINKITVCSGGGYSEFNVAVNEKAQLFITGEEAHSLYHNAKESEINVIFAGHYLTETFGVLALKELIEEKLSLSTQFAFIPTNL